MFKKSLFLILSLSACNAIGGGGGGGSATSANLGSFTGDTFDAVGASMSLLDGYDPVRDNGATVQIVSTNEIRVNGTTLTREGKTDTFRSDDGDMVLTLQTGIDGLTTTQILYTLLREEAGSDTTLTPLVLGNRTDASAIPQSGSASFAGQMTIANDLSLTTTVEGPVLFLSLSTGDVTGNLVFADTYFLVLDPTKLTNGSFYTTMASNEPVPVMTGTIDGALYGKDADEIGGTISLEYAPDGTPIETYLGYYGATKQ